MCNRSVSTHIHIHIYISIQRKLNTEPPDVNMLYRDEAERLGRALGCKLLRTSVKEDIGVMSVFRHLASRCLHEMRRSDDDYQDDLRLYSAEPRTPSVISTIRDWIFSFSLSLSLPQFSLSCFTGRTDRDESFFCSFLASDVASFLAYRCI